MEKTRYRKIYYSQYLVVVLALVILIGLALFSHWAMQQVTYEDQFVIPWAAGRAWLLDGTDPYDAQVIHWPGQPFLNRILAVDSPRWLN